MILRFILFRMVSKDDGNYSRRWLLSRVPHHFQVLYAEVRENGSVRVCPGRKVGPYFAGCTETSPLLPKLAPEADFTSSTRSDITWRCFWLFLFFDKLPPSAQLLFASISIPQLCWWSPPQWYWTLQNRFEKRRGLVCFSSYERKLELVLLCTI